MGTDKNIKLHIVTDIKQRTYKQLIMTRWARGGQGKQVHDATSWDELKPSKKQHPFKQNRKLHTGATVQKSGVVSGVVSEKVSEKVEKQRAARRMRRKKGKPCFNCRKTGHLSSECPLKGEGDASDICFKCGSTDHNVHQCREAEVGEGEYPFAKCYICKQNGHLSGNCPDNPRGLYPDGGGCKFCGSVEHYKRDCPEKNGDAPTESSTAKRKFKLREENESVDAIVNSEDEAEGGMVVEETTKKKKVIKF